MVEDKKTESNGGEKDASSDSGEFKIDENEFGLLDPDLPPGDSVMGAVLEDILPEGEGFQQAAIKKENQPKYYDKTMHKNGFRSQDNIYLNNTTAMFFVENRKQEKRVHVMFGCLLKESKTVPRGRRLRDVDLEGGGSLYDFINGLEKEYLRQDKRKSSWLADSTYRRIAFEYSAPYTSEEEITAIIEKAKKLETAIRGGIEKKLEIKHITGNRAFRLYVQAYEGKKPLRAKATTNTESTPPTEYANSGPVESAVTTPKVEPPKKPRFAFFNYFKRSEKDKPKQPKK